MDTLSALKRATLYIICAAVIAVALFFCVKYVLPAALPIILAAAIAALIRKPVKLLRKTLKLPEKLAAALLVLLITAALSLAIYYIAFRGCAEIVSLTEGISAFIERLKSDRGFAENLIDKISSLFPFWDIRPRLTELWLDIDSSLEALLMDIAERISGSVIPVITGAVAFVPDAIFFVLVTVLSAYYISVGGAKMKRDFMALLPAEFSSRLERAYISVKATAGGFVRAYMLIMAITFTELFVMFSLAKIRYAFLIALFTATVDLLPVLGTGTVLIPWAIVLLISGNTSTGVAILVIYAVITLVRQLIEPRIVGESVGISPFASLASMYIGLKLLGAIGLFIFPLAVIGLQNAAKRKTDAAKIENS